MPHYGVQDAKPSQDSTPANKGTKRKIGFPDGQVSPPTGAIANQVSGKRKRCDDSQTDISILPQLDAGILERVRDLGHYPTDFKQATTQEQRDERTLVSHIRQLVFVFRPRGLQGMARSIAPSPNYLYPQNHLKHKETPYKTISDAPLAQEVS